VTFSKGNMLHYSSRTCIYFTLSMCKNILKTYKKSHVWSQNLGEQKIGSGATAYKLGERSRRSRHGSRAPELVIAMYR